MNALHIPATKNIQYIRINLTKKCIQTFKKQEQNKTKNCKTLLNYIKANKEMQIHATGGKTHICKDLFAPQINQAS